MNKILYTTIILCFAFVAILLSYFTLTIEVVRENENYNKNNLLNNQEIFAQEDDDLLL